jgi:hypothetical protein
MCLYSFMTSDSILLFGELLRVSGDWMLSNTSFCWLVWITEGFLISSQLSSRGKMLEDSFERLGQCPYTRHCRGRRWREPLSLFGGFGSDWTGSKSRHDSAPQLRNQPNQRSDTKNLRIKYQKCKVSKRFIWRTT